MYTGMRGCLQRCSSVQWSGKTIENVKKATLKLFLLYYMGGWVSGWVGEWVGGWVSGWVGG